MTGKICRIRLLCQAYFRPYVLLRFVLQDGSVGREACGRKHRPYRAPQGHCGVSRSGNGDVRGGSWVKRFLVTAFICLCVFCRWCHAPLPAFRRCKVTTRFPFLQEVSDLAPPRFRPAVRSGRLLMCARSQAYRSGRGTPALQGPLEGENGVSFFPNWRNFVTQLGSKFFPVRQQHGTARCPERPQCPASTGSE